MAAESSHLQAVYCNFGCSMSWSLVPPVQGTPGYPELRARRTPALQGARGHGRGITREMHEKERHKVVKVVQSLLSGTLGNSDVQTH